MMGGREWALSERGPMATAGGSQVGHRPPVMTSFFPLVCLWKRYYYYLTHGIRKDMIAPEDSEVMVQVSKLISNALLISPSLEPLVTVLLEEKENDYYNSLKKSIGEARRKREGAGPMWRAPFFLHLVPLKMPKTSFNFLIKRPPPPRPSVVSANDASTLICIHKPGGLVKMPLPMRQVWGGPGLCTLTGSPVRQRTCSPAGSTVSSKGPLEVENLAQLPPLLSSVFVPLRPSAVPASPAFTALLASALDSSGFGSLCHRPSAGV